MTALDRARDLLRRASSVTALTGAGVSAASGIPPFRAVPALRRPRPPRRRLVRRTSSPCRRAPGERHRAACDVFLSIDTSSVVYPAAGLVHVARAHGATIIEINPELTDASAEVDIAVRVPAEEALPAPDLSRDVGADRVRTVQWPHDT